MPFPLVLQVHEFELVRGIAARAPDPAEEFGRLTVNVPQLFYRLVLETHVHFGFPSGFIR